MQIRYQPQPGTDLCHLAARNWEQMQFKTMKRMIATTIITVLELRPVNPASAMKFIIFLERRVDALSCDWLLR